MEVSQNSLVIKDAKIAQQDRLLSTDDGRPHAQLQPLRDLLEAETRTRPRAVIKTLNQAGWTRTLGQLARSHLEITHESLDNLPPGQHVQYLRNVLVNAEVLTPRSEELESTLRWLDTLLAGLPAARSQIIRPYATWSVLRRARNRARKRPPTRSVLKYMRSRITLAADFLTWLSDRGQDLRTASQAELDQWLERGSTNRYRLHDFIDWANARGLTTQQLHGPRRKKAAPSQRLDDEQHWKLLQCCLHDDAIELRVRVAAGLVLLYGQTPSRIVTLTTADIVADETHTFLMLNSQPVLLPPRLATLITRLAAEEPTGRRPLIEQPNPKRPDCSSPDPAQDSPSTTTPCPPQSTNNSDCKSA